jgi:methylation protein EvaC
MKKIFLKLGSHPLANSFQKKYLKNNFYNLAAAFDTKLKLVSITKHLESNKMFNKSYPYRSGQSQTVKKLFRSLTVNLKKKFKINKVLEIGSNDGTFASNFKKKEIVCIEPCYQVAQELKKKGYTTYIKYFNNHLVKSLKKKYFNFDLIFSANTITHISNLDNVFYNIKKILSQEGILIIEDPSLLECIKKNTYDQFYNEHIYIFSLISLKNIINKYDLEIFDIKKIKIHGGSLRFFIKHKKNKKLKISKNVSNQLLLEKKNDLDKFSTYKNFSENVKNSKKKLIKIFQNIKKNGGKIIGYGASAKAVTILNYCNLKEDYIDYFMDTTKAKIGKYLPGTKIKIYKYKKLQKDKKLYVFLGAWNFKKEILKKEQLFFNNSGKFIIHSPFPKILKK